MATETATNGNMDTNIQELPINWKWMLLLGIMMIFLGTLGIYWSVAYTIASVLFFGALMGTAGVMQLIQGIQAKEKKWVGRAQHFIVALLYIIAAGLTYWDPIAAAQGMTLALSALFAALGITKIIYAFQCKSKNWRWVLPVLIGLINIALGVMIFLSWPASGLWVIGLFVAIELIMNGWFLTLVSLQAKNTKAA